MKYGRFEELPVWQAAADLAAAILPWAGQGVFRGKGDLANQLQRATLSISNNIAEGFERGSTSELLQFLYIARGSAGEVRSMLCVMQRIEGFSALQSDISAFQSQCENIARQLRGWANSLQNSDIQGQRHLNDRSREDYDSRKRREAFLQEQKAFRERLEAQLKERARRTGGEYPR